MNFHLTFYNPKKTILITSLGFFFIGSLYAVLRIYYRNRLKQKKSLLKNKKLVNGSLTGGKSTTNTKLSSSRPFYSDYDVATKKIGGLKPPITERSILRASSIQDDIKNFPAEELLELGINYLNQAIKSWETALDSIESAAYMQSQTLALPNDEHADLVFKLRTLLDKANDIGLNCTTKLIKSSQTLQIIQSRLAYKQQLYADALLHKSNQSLNQTDVSSQHQQEDLKTPVGSLSKRFGYLSDDEDNESFVSAGSEFDWLDNDLFERIENTNDKNALYEMAMSNVNLGRVSYRVSRSHLLECKSEHDFAAKLHAIRLGFDRLLQDPVKKEWFIEQGRELLRSIMIKADKESSGLIKNYDDFIQFVMAEGDWKLIKDELATREVTYMNFFDIVIDFILLDAFDDLDNPPGAIQAVIQNRWLSQSFKESALSTAVWSVLKAKRRILKYPNGFISRFYSINEYLVPVLAWGFLGTNAKLNEKFNFLKSHVVEYLRCLFDLERTRFTNLDELCSDLEQHSIKYLREIINNIESF